LKNKKIEIERHRENKRKRDEMIQKYKEENFLHKMQLLNKADEKVKERIQVKKENIIFRNLPKPDLVKGRLIKFKDNFSLGRKENDSSKEGTISPAAS